MSIIYRNMTVAEFRKQYYKGFTAGFGIGFLLSLIFLFLLVYI